MCARTVNNNEWSKAQHEHVAQPGKRDWCEADDVQRETSLTKDEKNHLQCEPRLTKEENVAAFSNKNGIQDPNKRVLGPKYH